MPSEMVPQETKCLQIQIDTDSETDDESLQVVARKVVDNVVSKVLDSQVEVHHKANEHGGDPDDKETLTKDKISWPIRVTVGLTPEVRLKVQQLRKVVSLMRNKYQGHTCLMWPC